MHHRIFISNEFYEVGSLSKRNKRNEVLMEQKKNDRDRVRKYRRMTFGQLQKRWLKTSVGQRRGPLKLGADHLELALNLVSFDIGARLETIRELTRKDDRAADAKIRMKNHHKQLMIEADFLYKAGLYLLDTNRQ